MSRSIKRLAKAMLLRQMNSDEFYRVVAKRKQGQNIDSWQVACICGNMPLPADRNATNNRMKKIIDEYIEFEAVAQEYGIEGL